MCRPNYFNSIISALPNDITIDEFKKYALDSIWQKDKDKASIIALFKCDRIDWRAYKTNYLDDSYDKIETIKHFLDDGIFTGKKLYSYYPSHKDSIHINSQIKVSIIIPSYNNELYLMKCIDSVICQSIKEIEIIIVDDCSTDDSYNISMRKAQEDKRIKLIKQHKNKGAHMARKAGVMEACGDFIMFLDSDDFYIPNACEIAFKAACKGYDIVQFGVEIVNHGCLNAKEISAYDYWYNSYHPTYYETKDMLDDMIIRQKLSHSLCHKIYERNMLQKSFAQMEDEYFTLTEDFYEFLVILSNTRNFYSIKDKIYVCNRGIGMSFYKGSQKAINRRLGIEKLLNPSKKFLNKNNINIYYDYIIDFLFTSSAKDILGTDESNFNYFIKKLAGQYGILRCIKNILKRYQGNYNSIFNKFQFLHQPTINKACKNIGIYCPNTIIDNSKTIFNQIMHTFENQKLNIHLFTDYKSDISITCNEPITIHRNHYKHQTIEDIHKYLTIFYDQITKNNVDIVIYFINEQTLTWWNIFLLNLLNIPIIGILFSDIPYLVALARKSDSVSHQWSNILKVMNKVICFSDTANIYMRINGIDSTKISLYGDAPYIKKVNNDVCCHILYTGAISSNNKQLNNIFLIIESIRKKNYEVKIYIIDDFINKDFKLKFKNMIKKYSLNNNFIYISEINDDILNKIQVILSTSYMEDSFKELLLSDIWYKSYVHLGSYIPWNLKKQENSKYTYVKNYKEAANSIIDICSSNLCIDQSIIETKKEQKTNKISIALTNIIENCSQFSEFNHYTSADYIKTINILAKYVGRAIPSF